MFEKIGQSAETLVRRVSVSRRGFLGRAAKVAAALGAALAGFVAIPTDAEASSNGGWCKVCRYDYFPQPCCKNKDGTVAAFCAPGQKCPQGTHADCCPPFPPY